MTYTAHYFTHLARSMRTTQVSAVPGETVAEARASANILLPTVIGAVGFRLCDGAGRQVDIYVPDDMVGPIG